MWLVYIALQFTLLLLNLANLRDLFVVETKLKGSIFENNNQIIYSVITRTWVLSTEWIRTWPSTGLVSEWKSGGGPRLFESSMLFFSERGYCVVLTKIKAMNLCLFWLFKEILSMQFFWNIQRKANDPGAM